MKIPQVLVLFFIFFDIGWEVAKDGQPRQGTYCGGALFVMYLMFLAILWWGGFFK